MNAIEFSDYADAINVNGIFVAVNFVLLYDAAIRFGVIPFIEPKIDKEPVACDPPHHYSKKGTLPNFVVFGACLCFVTIFVVIVELIRVQIGKPKTSYRFLGRDSPPLLVLSVTYVGYTHIGFLINEIFGEMIRRFVHRNQPNIANICAFRMVTCNSFGETSSANCGVGADEIMQNSRSFYCQETAIAAFTAVWIVLYLEARVRGFSPYINVLLVSILQLCALLAAIFVGSIQYGNNSRHLSDVYCGFAAGAVSASLTAVYVARIMPIRPNVPPKMVNIDESESARFSKVVRSATKVPNDTQKF